ncbi:GNAT family N-acetyltransferase [Candidatus Gracilibacteria bacterium]|nr:GNAT family N-acetyltransferase [Candidatus Gracilibacteria bacterium]
MQPFLQNLTIRPAQAADIPSVAAFLSGLSQRSLYLRYLMPLPSLALERAVEEARRLCNGERARVTLVALAGDEQVVGLAELVRDRQDATIAEVAIVVADQYQRVGIGTLLSDRLAAYAPGAQIRIIRAYSLPHNHAVRHLFARSGRPFSSDTRQGLTCYQLSLAGTYVLGRRQKCATLPFKGGVTATIFHAIM